MKTQKNNGNKIAVSVIVNAFENDGTTVRAIRILNLLKNHYDLSLITRANEKQNLKSLEDVKVIIVKPDKTKLWNLKLIPTVIKNKFDVVYCSDDWFGFLTYYLLSKIYKYKIIFEAHDVWSEEEKKRGFSKILVKLNRIHEKFVIEHADHVIAVAGFVYKFYKKYNKKIDLIPLFTDEDILKQNEEVINYKVKKSSKLVGFIGPFDTLHNEPALNFLYENLNHFDRRINFTIIGKCNNKIENKRIVYVGYLDSIQDYVDQLSRLDAVLVYKSVAPGPYTKVLESMSCSLPVFTVPKAVVGFEHVEHGIDILILEDDSELIDSINELIFDDKVMREIGRNARIRVKKYYSKKVNEKKLVDIIENLDRQRTLQINGMKTNENE